MDKKKALNMNVSELLSKLNDLYDKEDKLKITMNKLRNEYTQLQEDKELLQMFIMHKSNKNSRN